jgi:peptidoglycan/LPS O-acetylase OafA/YrhL
VKRLGYQPALDGVRGLAIACVVAYHAFGRPSGGFLGVDLFFVLSGFLITTLLLEEHAERGSISLRAFYRRRALRLVPALVAMLTVVLAVEAALALVGKGHLRREAIAAGFGLGYVTDFVNAISPGTVPWSLSHLWSLAMEEQFYLLWPPILLVLGVRRRAALAVLAGALALVAVRQVELMTSGAAYDRLQFAPDTRGSSIVIGCLFAVVFSTARSRRRLASPVVGGLALTVLAGLIFVGLLRPLFGGPLLLFGAAVGVVIARALEPSSFEHRILTMRPLVGLGRVSYGLYLWHVPVLAAVAASGQAGPTGSFVRGAFGIALSLAAALVSYRVVEQPFLRRKRRPGGARPAPAYEPKSRVLRTTVLSNSART